MKIVEKNTVGMFDFFKGLGMLFVIYAHTLCTLQVDYLGAGNLFINIISAAVYLFGLTVLLGFFAISGYGFRQRDNLKCIKNSASLYIKPFVITGFATCFFHALFHYLTFGSARNAVKETLKIFAGLLLGLKESITLKNIELFSVGPMWYLLALFWGYLILNFLLQHFSGKKMLFMAIGCLLLGCLFYSILGIYYYSIGNGLIGVLFIYLGYILKKKKFFVTEVSKASKVIVLLGIFVFMPIYVAHSCLGYFHSTNFIWTNFEFYLSGYMTFVFLIVGVYVSKFSNPVVHFIKNIGKNTLYILCVHTVEFTAVPLYLLSNKFGTGNWKMAMLVFVCRFLIDYAIVIILKKIIFLYNRSVFEQKNLFTALFQKKKIEKDSI